jgi:hypothetical protein
MAINPYQLSLADKRALCERVIDLRAGGMNLKEACRIAGPLHHLTFVRWMQADKVLHSSYQLTDHGEDETEAAPQRFLTKQEALRSRLGRAPSLEELDEDNRDDTVWEDDQ